MKITKHMQSCFLIEASLGKILIDPGTYVFNQEGVNPNDFQKIDAIIITHEHQDHFDLDNIEKIYQKNSPVFYTTSAILPIILEKMPEATVKILGSQKADKISDLLVTGVASKHGPLPTGAEPPIVAGALIDDGETKFYHPGDSVFLDDKINADIIATPICGEVVMDIQKAKIELLKLNPKIAIPMHYDNPRFPVDVNDFDAAMKDTGIEVTILNPGQMFEV